MNRDDRGVCRHGGHRALQDVVLGSGKYRHRSARWTCACSRLCTSTDASSRCVLIHRARLPLLEGKVLGGGPWESRAFCCSVGGSNSHPRAEGGSEVHAPSCFGRRIGFHAFYALLGHWVGCAAHAGRSDQQVARTQPVSLAADVCSISSKHSWGEPSMDGRAYITCTSRRQVDSAQWADTRTRFLEPFIHPHIVTPYSSCPRPPVQLQSMSASSCPAFSTCIDTRSCSSLLCSSARMS